MKLWSVFAAAVGYWQICEAKPADSKNGDLESVCRRVIETSGYWGTHITKFVPSCDEKIRGLGPKVLEVAALSSNYSDLPTTTCYAPVSSALCNIQFEKYASLPGCPTTTALFFDIIATCQKSSILSAGSVNCPSFDRASQVIGDPSAFCEGAVILEEGPEDPLTGLPSSYTTKTFTDGQQQDCQQAATSYNACVRIGVAKLGYKMSYCTGEGFSAYCSSTLNIVKDASFLLTCENVVVPAFVEYFLRHHGRMSSTLCDNLYQKWLTFLAARKGAALVKSRAALDTLRSTARVINYWNEAFTSALIKSEGIDSGYISTANQLFETMNAQDPLQDTQGLGYTPTVINAFSEVEKLANSTATFSQTLQLPEKQQDGTVSFSEMRRVNSLLDQVVALQQATMQSAQKLTAQLRDVGGSMTYLPTSANGYNSTASPITKDKRNSLNKQFTLAVDSNSKFRSDYDAMIEVFPNKQTHLDQLYVNEGVRQVRLGLLRDTQLRLLISIHSKKDPSEVIKAASI